MLFDELKDILKQAEPDLETIKSFYANTKLNEKLDLLSKESNKEEFWQNPNRTEILKELQKIRLLNDQYNYIINSYNDLNELIKLFSEDESELLKLKNDINQLCRQITKFKIILLLDKPNDDQNCFLSINSGAGGTESQDWANMLLRMYLRFCEKEELKSDIIDYQAGEGAGIKSATIYIKGKNAYGLLKTEHGVHRLVRISPFDAAKRRHTSFAAIHVIPEAGDNEIKIDPKDLRIDTYRAGGAGGQHVNKTESAVRITHIPTNTVVQCQSERSQMQNKETAMKMLVAKLAEKQQEEREAALAKIEKKKIEWGSQIRSYILHPYKLVKDHRTEIESPQPDLILDGEIMPFIEAALLQSHK